MGGRRGERAREEEEKESGSNLNDKLT